MGAWNDSLKATLRFERPERVCQSEWGYWPEPLAAVVEVAREQLKG